MKVSNVARENDKAERGIDPATVGKLTRFLIKCANTGPSFYLKIHTVYGETRITLLHGFHVTGQPWKVFEHDKMVPFTYKEMELAMTNAGVEFRDRPVKQNGFDYHWCIYSVGNPGVTMMAAPGVEAMERYRQEDRFQEIAR